MQRVGEFPRRRDRVRPAREQPRHLRRRLQMPLGVGVEPIAGGPDRHFLADAGDDVLQRPAIGRMVMDIVGGEDRAAVRARQPIQPLDPRRVVAAIKPARRGMAERRQCVAKPRQLGLEGVEIFVRPGDEGDAVGMLGDIAQRQFAFAFLGAHLAEAQEPRQAPVALAVDRVSEQARRVGKVEAATDQRLEPRALAGAVHADDAGERVAVGDADPIHPQLERAQHQLDRVRRAAQEGEWRGDAKLDERRAGHRRRRHLAAAHQLEAREAGFLRHQPNSPWMNQAGAPPRPSPMRPSR